MTLVISAVTEKGIWQVSDRRLTFPKFGRLKTDEATKTIRLDLTNGRALISYAGIGAVGDVQISEWLKRLFQGRRLSYIEARNILASSATKRLSPLNKSLHEFVFIAFVDGKPRMEIVTDDRTNRFWIHNANQSSKFCLWAAPEFRRAVYFSGSGREALARIDKRIVPRTLKRKSIGIAQMEAALVAVHRKAWKHDISNTISEECICTYIDKSGEGWSHLHSASGVSKILIPTIMAGLPVSDIVLAIKNIRSLEPCNAWLDKHQLQRMSDDIENAINSINIDPDDTLY